MGKIAITSDCTCDLSDKILDEYDIKLIYFYMHVDCGRFKDSYEITAANVLEYLENGGRKMVTLSPDIEEISEFYEQLFKQYDETIHISISSKISESYEKVMAAAERFEGKVHVIDGGHLSTGTGHLVLRAAELVGEGKSAEEVVEIVEAMKAKVSTTFILNKLDCFYRTGRVKICACKVCEVLKIHPIIGMKNGKMTLKGIRWGDFENSVMRYVRNELRKESQIHKKRVFITHTNCKVSLISKVKKKMQEYCNFEKVYVTRASATITGNCGADTIGVLFVRE